MARFEQPFRQQVCRLINRGEEANLVATESNLFTYKMIVKFDVTGSSMENRVGSHVRRTEIITVKVDRERSGNTKLMEQVGEPGGLGTCMR
ncbi:hypothetical protein PS1_036896 [Malus domestica]